MSSSKLHLVLLLLTLNLMMIHHCLAVNKYSKEMNQPKAKAKTKAKTEFSMPGHLQELRELEKPFRMHKINVVWTKAKHRLTDPKLQSLYSDLRIHDKEELELKHRRAEGAEDETGMEEARLRKKLLGIMSNYNLVEHFEEVDHENYKKSKPSNTPKNYPAKDVFKDVRLNQLWAKAENGGFSDEELKKLKEEFSHHQDKLDEYHSLESTLQMGDPKAGANSIHGKPESWNELENKEEGESNDVPRVGEEDEYLAKARLLKEKHLGVRSGYDHLEGLAAKAPKHREFVDPKVQALWSLAQEAPFTDQELNSLKEELIHYEKRLIKLRQLHSENAVEAAKAGMLHEPNTTHAVNIKKHLRDVEKLHRDIEERISLKHAEL